jgi:hypothetical protein
MKLLKPIMLVFILTGAAVPQTAVTFCDLVRNPKKYNGKQVVVRATYRSWLETSHLYCLDCLDQGKVWLEMPIELEDTSAHALNKMPKAGIVNLTVQGVFFSGGSFGHQNGYQYKIEPNKISDVVILQKGLKPPQEEKRVEKKWACGGE